MRLSLDPGSSVPLFHQIVVALKHKIAVGTLTKGERLPSVKDASRQWKVHFHTVRRAYQVLSEEGLLLVGRGKPTTVVGDSPAPGAHALDAFLAQVLQEADEVFALSPREFIQRLEGMTRPSPGAGLYVLECTEEQAASLASEIQQRWHVEASGWALDRRGEPPPGLLVSTFFHFREVRGRWPERLGDLHFVAIHPDQGIPERIRTRLGRMPRRVLVCESDASMAENLAADLRPLLSPSGVHLDACVVEGERTSVETLAGGAVCLFGPRVWGGLAASVREQAGAFEARYCIRPADLDALGSLIRVRSDLVHHRDDAPASGSAT